MDKLETSGVVNPLVAIGDRTLVVRCSFYAEYQLSLAGLTLAGCLQILTAQRFAGAADPRGVASMCDMFAACVSENYPDRAPTAKEWAKTISDLPDSQAAWKAICQAVDQAISKRLLASVPPAAPPATAEPPALTN
jgi:hypothetical protein